MLIAEGWFSLISYFRTGGPVMVPLLLVSLGMWLLIAERAMVLRRLSIHTFSGPVALECVQERQVEKARQGGAVGLLILRFLDRASGDLELDRNIIDELVLSLNRSLTLYLPLIGVLAAIAPLLGLLGTVTGMMSTFDVMSLFGTGDAKGMAGGISEALITTQTGLIVAIPGLYMKNFLERRAQALQRQLTATGFYLRRHLQEASC
nr:MotA/TolQ/ExbB proton channel family protein [uncultured Desulfobulbus sp.]